MNTLFDVVRPTIPISMGMRFLTKLIGTNTYKWFNSLYKIIIRGGARQTREKKGGEEREREREREEEEEEENGVPAPPIMILYRLLSYLYVFFPLI